LSELADYRKIQGTAMFLENYSENTKLAKWVTTQRREYRLSEKEIIYDLPYPGIGKLGFRWGWLPPAGRDRLSELADYRKITALQCS
jgi:hypothetical protein